jgi:hypothetical protein
MPLALIGYAQGGGSVTGTGSCCGASIGDAGGTSSGVGVSGPGSTAGTSSGTGSWIGFSPGCGGSPFNMECVICNSLLSCFAKVMG